MGKMRVLAKLVYLGATAWWALIMLMAGGYRCDESCSELNPRDWHDHRDAWQYGVIGWLSAAGLALAIAAVATSARRKWLGAALLTLHACVFTANCLVWYLGRTIYGSFIPFALVAGFVAVCGFVAIGGNIKRPAWPPRLRPS